MLQVLRLCKKSLQLNQATAIKTLLRRLTSQYAMLFDQPEVIKAKTKENSKNH